MIHFLLKSPAVDSMRPSSWSSFFMFQNVLDAIPNSSLARLCHSTAFNGFSSNRSRICVSVASRGRPLDGVIKASNAPLRKALELIDK